MKTLLITILLSAVTLSAYAKAEQTIYYHSVTKSDTTRIKWIESETENGRRVTITIGSQLTVIDSDRNYVTTGCHITDRAAGTDVTISLSAGKYILRGTFRNKACHLECQSAGRLWVQNISYSVGHLAHLKGSFEYECFRPDNLEFSEMQASDKGMTSFRGERVRDIKISPSGLKAAFWSCHYYLDDDWRYVAYRGVNGGPGTSETIMYRVQ